MWSIRISLSTPPGIAIWPATVIARLHGEKKPVFVVGGTGLYIRALLGGLIAGPGADESLRQTLKEEMKRWGNSHLYEKLRMRDEKAAAQINPHDGVRIIRALEVLELTGRSIVDHQKDHRFGNSPTRSSRSVLCWTGTAVAGKDWKQNGPDDRGRIRG